MRLTNDTGWRTEDLRRLIAAACRADGIGTRGMVVAVRHTRQRRGCTGYGWINSRSMVLRVPPPLGDQESMPDAVRDSLARVALHELAHCRGIVHGDMEPSLRWCRDDLPTPWADGLVVRRMAATVVAPRNVVAERAEHAAAMLRRAERRLKLARSIERRWRAKVRYYERRAAASGGVLESRPRAPRAPMAPSWVPTVAAVRRALGAGVRVVEAGMRLAADGKPTFDQRLWPDDVDLEDIRPLSDLLAQVRLDLAGGGVVADLYVHGDAGLMGNATLSVAPEGWSVVWS